MRWWPLLLCLTLVAAAPTPSAPAATAAATTTTLHDLDLVSIDGTPVPDEALRGKVVLVVNVASFCGYTPQYASLQALWKRYEARGLVVLGVPCNQFGNQEPGSADEIQSFCSSRFGVSFPLLTKQDVNGTSRSPLYQWLVHSRAGGGVDVGWNFEKFLVGRDGRVIARFGSHVVPLDPVVVTAIELALGPPST